MTVQTAHSLTRTNAKGQPFIGRCVLCGKEGLTAREANDYCENITGRSREDAIADAAKGPQR